MFFISKYHFELGALLYYHWHHYKFIIYYTYIKILSFIIHISSFIFLSDHVRLGARVCRLQCKREFQHRDSLAGASPCYQEHRSLSSSSSPSSFLSSSSSFWREVLHRSCHSNNVNHLFIHWCYNPNHGYDYGVHRIEAYVSGHCPLSSQGSPNNMRRRKSLPTVPVFNRQPLFFVFVRRLGKIPK